MITLIEFILAEQKMTTISVFQVMKIQIVELQFMVIYFSDGKSILAGLQSLAVLHHFSFKTKVHDLKFSPNGRYIYDVTSRIH